MRNRYTGDRIVLRAGHLRLDEPFDWGDDPVARMDADTEEDGGPTEADEGPTTPESPLSRLLGLAEGEFYCDGCKGHLCVCQR